MTGDESSMYEQQDQQLPPRPPSPNLNNLNYGLQELRYKVAAAAAARR